MQAQRSDPPAVPQDEGDQRSCDTVRDGQAALSALQSSTPVHRSYDSWIEVSSQPSSSSLSSAADEIITTGLRVQQNHHRRRRRLRHADGIHLNIDRRSRAEEGSSQDEYDGGESESDRMMTSSNEAIHAAPSPLQHEWRPASPEQSTASSSEDDDDENATAINAPRGSDSRFTPSPNAFSHPPNPTRTMSHQSSAHRPSSNSMPSGNRPHRNTRHFSYPSGTRRDERSHSPFPSLAGSSSGHAAHHDAALRASLSTLLSFGAAAARALPKSSSRATTGASMAAVDAQSSRIRPDTLQLVPEDEIHGTGTAGASCEIRSATEAPAPLARPRSPTQRKHTTRTDTSSARKKARRKSPSPSRWATRHSGSIDTVTPTLLTWVLSAGVLVLVGALGFGAGYAVGRTEGKADAVREGLMRGDVGGVGGDSASRSWFGNGTVRRGWGSVKA